VVPLDLTSIVFYRWDDGKGGEKSKGITTAESIDAMRHPDSTKT